MNRLNESITLPAGERFNLEDGARFALVESGNAAFPGLDEFEQIETLLYALENSRIKIFNFYDVARDELKIFMRNWFAELIKLLRPELLATFGENEAILSMLLGVRFAAQDKKFSRRAALRETNQRRTVDEAISNLLGEETYRYGENLSLNEKIEDATFAVRCVAKFFDMPTDNIKSSPDVTKKLDQIRILRRLLQKGNLQMRLVTLVDGRHKKDSGILVGWCGEEKTLTDFLRGS